MEENDIKKPRFKSLVIDDTKYKTHLTPKFANREKWAKPDSNKIYSFIPGTVLDVSAKKGQKLKKGAKVLILEAMKMKNKIYCHKACVIKNVYVKKGDSIPKGKLLYEIEPVKSR